MAVDYFAVGVIGYECMFGKVSGFKFECASDLTLDVTEKRSETIFCPSRFKLDGMTSPQNGV